MHVLAYMEQTTLDRIVTGAIAAEDLNQACPWDNIDGTPNRRPDLNIQDTMGRFMRCPSAPQSTVEYNGLSLQNLRKGNYAACFGGDSFIHSTPSGNPNSQMLGVFGVVSEVTKASRKGEGKGTKITAITDGTSNTVMLSEVLAWHTPIRTSSSSPSGTNQDWRGVMLCPGIGASSFTTKTAPNSRTLDRIPGCESSPASYGNLPNPYPCERNTADGFTWAAARSMHSGGVNATFGDGSVKFIRDSIAQNVWSALGTRAGGEVVSDY
jgi:prepilin-type processing-associated H-X9-DG protein